MKLLGIEQLVGTAMSSDSNGIAENKIRTLRRIFAPILERHTAAHWKFGTPTAQTIVNMTPSEHDIVPEHVVMSFSPRRITDLLHDVSTLPDSDIKRLLEDRAAVMEELRLQRYEAQQQATERQMERQAGMFRDLPKGWAKSGKSWWVWLHAKYFSRTANEQAGSRHKQLKSRADGPFAVTKVEPDGIHFHIEPPEWMKHRQDGRFHVKAIRAITDTHPDPDSALRQAIDRHADVEDDSEEFEITDVWARRPNKAKTGYEYKVLWKGHPLHEASYVDESDIEGSLTKKYDKACPRGSCRTDLPKDIDRYVTKNPSSVKQSSTAHYDETILERLRAPVTKITEPAPVADADPLPASASNDETAPRRSKRLSQRDLHYLNQMLNTLDGGQDADTVLSDISHLRDVLYTTYNQDLALGYRDGDLTKLAITDVIDINPTDASESKGAAGN